MWIIVGFIKNEWKKLIKVMREIYLLFERWYSATIEKSWCLKNIKKCHKIFIFMLKTRFMYRFLNFWPVLFILINIGILKYKSYVNYHLFYPKNALNKFPNKKIRLLLDDHKILISFNNAVSEF